MGYRIKDKIFERIEKKIADGIFTRGEDCMLPSYGIKQNISEYSLEERTPELCSSLMAYGNCKFSDVPESSRTREFFISTFSNDDVFDYIKNHITDFDRQFFKDLLASNKWATSFSNNCFAIMPVEYIDEEMCSLAILEASTWTDKDWFLSVYERKPEALTADLWKLGARLYARLSGEENHFLHITPEEYRDEEYYLEMCSCNFNCGMELDSNKGKIMDSIPQELLTPEFLLNLLLADINNISRFNEKALKTVFSYTKDGVDVKDKIWQFVIKLNGSLIRHIDLNDERVEFFLNHYDKDSSEYRIFFKDKYKEYQKEKNKASDIEQVQRREEQNIVVTLTSVLPNAIEYAKNGESPSRAIIDEVDNRDIKDSSFLPIRYQGIIPEEFAKEYDSEEYLEKIYNDMGIQIVEKHDRLFYRVILPKGWSTANEGYWNSVNDNDGNTIIKYFYDSKFYEKEAYVKEINLPQKETSASGAKVFVKSEQ